MQGHLLSIIVFLPLAGAVATLFLGRGSAAAAKFGALAVSIVTFALTLALYAGFDPSLAGFQFQETAEWLPQFGAGYRVGIDGLGLLMILLTSFLSVLAILGSWEAVREKAGAFMASLLALEAGMLGVFAATDFFLFYVFWEAMLVPMYFLIGVWGGSRRIYAAVKFFLFTMVGSVLMLLAALYLYVNYEAFGGQGEPSFDLVRLYALQIPANIQMWLFAAYTLAFAIKAPMFPVHTWLPDAHVEAPTAGSVILAGVLLKMGSYGLLRFCLPMFPDAAVAFAPAMIALSIVGIVYGALVAMVQDDVKKLVAYSSVSHMGFVVLGIFAFNAQGVQGAIIQGVNHGVSTGALFTLVGMIYERRHTRAIADFGGLMNLMPVFGAFFLIITLSSIGLPLTNGFVGEFLILVGAFQMSGPAAVLAAGGVILGAIYMLWMFQRVMYGETRSAENKNLKDLNLREILVLVPLAIMVFWIGLFPRTFLSRTETSTQALLENMAGKSEAAAQLLLKTENRGLVAGDGAHEEIHAPVNGMEAGQENGRGEETGRGGH